MKETIEALVAELNYHASVYYNTDKQSIVDSEYDKMYNRLKTLESEYPEYILPYSPTQRVGSQVASGFTELVHETQMASLDNAMDEEEFKKAFRIMKGNTGLIAELKADGMAINIQYIDGLLVTGASRGDGYSGDDLTHNVKTIKNIPLRLNTPTPPERLEIRGEALLTKVAFAEYNEKQRELGKSPLVNTRNGVAGALRKKDPAECAERNLSFQAYAIGQCTIKLPDTQYKVLELLQSWGFSVSEYIKVCSTLKQAMDIYNEVIERRHTFSIDIDGVVFKTNDLVVARSLGSTSHHPRSAVAFKLPTVEAQTTLLDIIYQTGSTGVITPVAIVEPVFVCGVTIRRITLNNANQMQLLGLRENDTVIVQRAGDVIPQLVGRVNTPGSESNPLYVFTKVCPCCGSPLVKKDNDSVAWLCTNTTDCRDQMINVLVNISERLDIDALGVGMIKNLYSNKILCSYVDLFKLKDKRNQLIQLEGYGEVSIDKVLKNIENAKEIPLNKYLYSLCIPEVGKSLSVKLATYFKSLDALVSSDELTLQSLPDIGPTISKYIVTYFNNEKYSAMYSELVSLGVVVLPHVQEVGVYTGTTFAVTGKFDCMGRKELTKHITDNGGVLKKISSKTNIALIGQKPESTYAKAKAFNIPCIYEADVNDALTNNKSLLDIPLN